MENVPAVQDTPVLITLEDVRRYIAPNATEKELFFFMNVCNRLNLDPIKREVHFVKYGSEPGQTVIGYTVYLKRAEDLQKLDGWKVWIENSGKPDEKAVIRIKRKDWSDPFEWEVMRREFDKKQAAWNRMPTFMLKKVCIAQGFRLAFPKEMGGLPYIPEEINGTVSEDLGKTGAEKESKVDPVHEKFHEEQNVREEKSLPILGTTFKDWLNAAGMAKDALHTDQGDHIYYGILGEYKHANKVTNRKEQERILGEWVKAIEGLKAASEVFETTEE